MSILDGMPSSRAEWEEPMKLASKMVDQLLGEIEFTPKQRSIVDLMNKGLSLADILRITKEERDALFVKGCRLIQVGQLVKAREFLTVLYQLEPLDARVIYALASTFQIAGDVSRAAKLYVHFLALDATNAEGYLRLGECFLAAGEFDQALESFQIALAECERGNGNAIASAHARKMIAEAKRHAVKASKQ